MNELKMRVKTFTQDYYLCDLPFDLQDQFYTIFPFYHKNFDYNKRQITFAPVARIYGTNQYGQKSCCHIHGFFPFFYIKCDQYSELLSQQSNLIQFLSQAQILYQKSYHVSKPIIYRGEIEHKYDFYGYHQKQQIFLKLTLYDPNLIRSVSEFFGSKILCNKSFQSYQSHISYFSQIFTDLNLFGLHQMKICGFTFRRNFQFMDLFQKIDPNLNNGVMNVGWKLTQLQKNKPEYFNSLYKTSICYLQFDIMVDCIINAYYEEENHQQQSVMDSSDQEGIQHKIQKKLKVKVTKALGQIWKDQKLRRITFNIQQPLQGKIDYSNNIQNSEEVRKGQKDPLWIDFYGKEKISDQFIKMVQSYKLNHPIPNAQTLFRNQDIIQNYSQRLETNNRKLVENVEKRWKFYGQRKLNIIQEIFIGERSQFPQWNQDSQSQEEVDEDEKLQKGTIKSAFDVLTQKRNGNTNKFRGNFKVHKAVLMSNSYFLICQYCKKRKVDCFCYNKPNIKPIKKFINSNQNYITYQYNLKPPSLQECLEDIHFEHQQPYFSDFGDLFNFYKISNLFKRDLKHAQYLQKSLKPNPDYPQLPIVSIKNELKLPYFWNISEASSLGRQVINNYIMQAITFQYFKRPPTVEDIIKQLPKQNQPKCQINRHFPSQNYKQQSFVSELICITYEILIGSNLFYGNPEIDQIKLIPFKITNTKYNDTIINGLIIQQSLLEGDIKIDSYDDVFIVKNERSLLLMFANIVFRVDADILISYDQEKRGIYYLTERGFAYSLNMPLLLSRSVLQMEEILEMANFYEYKIIKQTYLTSQLLLYGNLMDNSIPNVAKNEYFLNMLRKKIKQNIKKKPILRKKYKYDVISTKGRVNLNLYRICEFQLKLRCYSLESVVKHLFKCQLCQFTDNRLFDKFKEDKNFVLEYIDKRISFCLRIIQQLNIIGAIIEKSKVFGADFVSMMERGSQFKIQSVMCRVTKQNNYLTLSASKYQVANQSILQCRPFVAEPPKRFFSEPVLVFDFQSLYPSVMIAFNICYSTCLGSIKQLFKNGKVKKMGVSNNLSMDLQWIQQVFDNNPLPEAKKILSNYIYISPNQVAYVRKNVRQGIIPKILIQFLISRIMIKKSIKLYSKANLKRLLKEREIALKLFMNVMYGYTGATFTGRMPCSQIADSVVQISKYCLKMSMDYLINQSQYKGQVIYGDTDSIFFHVPKLALSESFSAGKKLAKEMTKLFPYPMEMKFEKVFESMVLVSKKRYYGKCYENSNTEAKYEGKGLQCVRRDGIQLTSKIMKDILNVLIDIKDLSIVKTMFRKNHAQLINGLKLQHELYLCKQVKLIKYSDKSIPAHGQAVKKLIQLDEMMNPKYGERVKYVVVNGESKTLKHRSISLFEYLMDQKKYKLDYQYYIDRLMIPPLSRTLTMVQLNDWIYPIEQISNPLNTNLFTQKICFLCNKQSSQHYICYKCLSADGIKSARNKLNQEINKCNRKCGECIGHENIQDIQKCVQLNCKQLYERRKVKKISKEIQPHINKLEQIIKNSRNIIQ